jgi:phosphatidylinositol glycan class Z
MVASFIIPIAMLSIFPHQEPRFIIPVLIPLVFLFAHWIRNSSNIDIVNITDNKKTNNKAKKENKMGLNRIWYICNIILALFYGFVHQGGVLPLTFHLSKELKAKPYLTHIHYFSSYTYPLPTGLLHLRNTKRTYTSNSGHKYILTKDFFMYELGSQSVHSIYNNITSIFKKCEYDLLMKRIPYRLYYALPYSFYNEFTNLVLSNETKSFKFSLVKTIYPHISIEKLPLSNIHWNYLNIRTIKNDAFSLAENLTDNILNLLKQFTLVLLQIEYINNR